MRARACFLLVPLLVGCGGASTTVHGTVTCNGEPLKYGHITFKPENGELAGGADILDGEYTLRQIKPGKKTVLIKSAATPRRVAARNGEREHIEMVAPVAPIPPDAEGNQAAVDIHSGDQQLDFEIRYSPMKK